MNHKSRAREESRRKALMALMLFALGLSLLGSVYIAVSGEVGEDRKVSDGSPALTIEKENYLMKTKTAQAVSDTSTQPMATSASGVLRSATFAMG